ncbi:helix-turn-helix transcriptional regulator [Cupriavidus basilensis]
MTLKQESAFSTTLPRDGVSRFAQFQPFVSLSREKWRQLANAGKAPQPIRMGQRCTVYRNAEIHAWLADPLNYCAQA